MLGVNIEVYSEGPICDGFRRVFVAQLLFQAQDFFICKSDRIFLVACHDGNLLTKCMIVSIIVPCSMIQRNIFIINSLHYDIIIGKDDDEMEER